MLPIKRWRGQAQGRNRAVAYHGLLWTVATHEDPAADIREQTRRCLARLDESLAEAGTDKTRLVSAQVFLADMSTKPAFDAVWNEWIGPDRGRSARAWGPCSPDTAWWRSSSSPPWHDEGAHSSVG